MTTLMELDLSFTVFETKGAEALANGLACQNRFENLNVSGNAIGDAGASALFRALEVNVSVRLTSFTAQRSSSVTSLTLANCGLTVSSGTVLLETLPRLARLSHLVLDGNGIGDSALALVLRCLKVVLILFTSSLIDSRIYHYCTPCR